MSANSGLYYFVLAATLFSAELVYFRVALRYGIIDKPNDRSSHADPVIRGGGVIFLLASWLWFFSEGGLWLWFILGLTLIALISFMDDLYPQKPVTRFLFHLAAMLLLFYQIHLFTWPVWLVITALIVSIGTINAFNFMDGINGITGVYAVVSVATFWFIDHFISPFTTASFLWTLMSGATVFLFFNFRKKARCFAGDVGSVSIAFALIFLLLQLIYKSDNFIWVLLLLVYGTDSVVTILYRLKNRENIFKAHRTHLYQYLCNELKLPHRAVSLLYGVLQLIINVIIILSFKKAAPVAVVCFAFYVIVYILIREGILRRLGRQGFFFRPVSN